MSEVKAVMLLTETLSLAQQDTASTSGILIACLKMNYKKIMSTHLWCTLLLAL